MTNKNDDSLSSSDQELVNKVKAQEEELAFVNKLNKSMRKVGEVMDKEKDNEALSQIEKDLGI